MAEWFSVFEISYDWYEGEHEETLLGKNVNKKQFERDLIKAKKFAQGLIGKEVKDYNYLGKGYVVGCLSEYYAQIVWYLTTKLEYIECHMDKRMNYEVHTLDASGISITSVEKINKRSELKIDKKSNKRTK